MDPAKTRLIKCECQACGLVMRLASKWAVQGLNCPNPAHSSPIRVLVGAAPVKLSAPRADGKRESFGVLEKEHSAWKKSGTDKGFYDWLAFS